MVWHVRRISLQSARGPAAMAWREIAYALRRLGKAPGFSLTTILTLALGIGASTAVFTLVDSVLLKPLGYRESGRLVAVWEHVRFLSPEPTGPNPRHFDLWQKRSTAFTGLTLVRNGSGGLATGTEHPRLVGVVTSYANLFDVLQVSPLLGRTFRSEDGVPGHDDVAILTYPLWQNLFAGDPDIIGKTVRVADTPRQIIGVLPASFVFPNGNALRAFSSKQGASRVPEPAIFVPAAVNLNNFAWGGEYGSWVALGRLKPGISLAQAESQLNAIEAQIAVEHLSDNEPAALRASVQPMHQAVVGNVKTGLWLLMAAVAAVLLLACVNLANAQLGRAVLRDREAAVRSALGASTFQIIWSSLAESVLLAFAGGALGIFLANVALGVFRHYSPIDVPRLDEVHLNTTVLLFALVVTFASSILFGTMPALRLVGVQPQAALQQNNSHTLGSKQSRQLRTWVMGLQVFGCTALLLTTGVFAKSLLQLLGQDKGFQTAHVIIAEVRLSPKLYGQADNRTEFIDAVLNNLRSIAGVQSAGFVSAMPLEGETWIEELSRVDKPTQQTLINLRWVSRGYFETMGERLLFGRFFEDRDRNLTNAVISQGLAKTLWPNEDPIGQQLQVEGRKFNVIGIVADSRSTSLKTEPSKMAYLHYKDRPPYVTLFTVRGAQAADQLLAAVQQAIWQYAPNISIARVKTLDSQVSDSLATERFQTSVLIAFAVAALLLAMLGIYGVLSVSVAGRTREIGVRMALGATREQMYSLTLSEAGIPVLGGLAGGLACGTMAIRIVHSLLYEVKVLDATVSTMVIVLLLTAAFMAAFPPARRAASVDPMEALRIE